MPCFTRVLAALTVLSAAAPGLAQAPPHAVPSAASAAQTPRSSSLTAGLMYELLLGELTLGEGNPQGASAYMLDAARRSGDEALFRRATEMAVQSRSGPAALQAVRAWREAFPHSVEANRYELQVLIVMGRVAETETPLLAVLDEVAPNEKIAFVTALPALYQRAADKSGAAQAVERALTRAIETPGLAAAAWTTIGRMRLQAGDQSGALSAARLGQNAETNSEWPALLALQLFAGNGEAEAEPVILRYLEAPEAKPEIQIAYVRTLVERDRSTDAHQQLDALAKRAPAYPDGWLIQGMLHADEQADARAEQALLHYLDLAAGMSGEPGVDRAAGRNQAWLILAHIAERKGDVAQAEKWLSKVDSPDQRLTVQVRRARLLARDGKLDEARQMIQSAPERNSDDFRLKIQAEAQLLREHGQAQQAFDLLANGLKQYPDDDGLLYDAAMVAETIGRLDETERMLRRVIELKPENAHAYNALGYALADRGLRLEEAKALIEKALQLSPDDAYIQDSLGWVEFRLGRIDEARSVLEQAYHKRPNAEIAAHLGEVLWTLGDQEAARAVWRAGLRLDANDQALRKTLQRLQVRP